MNGISTSGVPAVVAAVALGLAACANQAGTTGGTGDTASRQASGASTGTEPGATTGGAGAPGGADATVGGGATADTGQHGGAAGAGTASTDVGADPGAAAEAGATTGADAGAAAGATAGAAGDLAPQDREFLMTAAQNNLLEIQGSQLAQERATDDRVREFARMMLSDHTGATQRLQQIAAQKGVQPPVSLTGTHESRLEQLRDASGQEFDSMYVQQVGVQAHEQAVSLFQRAAEQAQDPEVRSFAQSTLPVLEQHLEEARELAGQVGATREAAATP